jgi:hypothetical protein
VGSEIAKIIFKEVNKELYPPSRVAEKVEAAGFPAFQVQDHRQLWKSGTRKRPERPMSVSATAASGAGLIEGQPKFCSIARERAPDVDGGALQLPLALLRRAIEISEHPCFMYASVTSVERTSSTLPKARQHDAKC